MSIVTKTAVITAGGTESNIIHCAASRPVRLVIPADWTAADLYVRTSNDGGQTLNNLYDMVGTEYCLKTASGRSILLPFSDWLGISTFALASGPASSRMAQAAERQIAVVLIRAAALQRWLPALLAK